MLHFGLLVSLRDRSYRNFRNKCKHLLLLLAVCKNKFIIFISKNLFCCDALNLCGTFPTRKSFSDACKHRKLRILWKWDTVSLVTFFLIETRLDYGFTLQTWSLGSKSLSTRKVKKCLKSTFLLCFKNYFQLFPPIASELGTQVEYRKMQDRFRCGVISVSFFAHLLICIHFLTCYAKLVAAVRKEKTTPPLETKKQEKISRFKLFFNPWSIFRFASYKWGAGRGF